MPLSRNEEADLLRWQQILLMRELDLGCARSRRSWTAGSTKWPCSVSTTNGCSRKDRLHQHGGGVEPAEYGTWATATQLRPLPGADLGRVPAHGQDDVPAPGS
ncbi:hypothetical protein [Streptomyces virginiae]|uniref:hypothetical protein n=1 Tax=Streptomyces virginiae TaxID=1961 RepID=UPI002E2B0C81|nr:hypothetical protein [Streptomyces virginiae]